MKGQLDGTALDAIKQGHTEIMEMLTKKDAVA